MMDMVTLLRSVLSSMSIHLHSNIILSKILVTKLEQHFWRYILVGFLAWRRWLTPFSLGCCVPAPKRGRLRHLVFNTRRDALIARHVARLVLGPKSLWSLMMKATYGSWSTKEKVRAGWGSSTIWYEICARVPKVIYQTRWIIEDE